MTDTATLIPPAFARSEVPLTEGTGGEHRTPRSEIQNIRYEGKKYEPAFALDLSPSMFWGTENEDDRTQDYPHPKSRRAVLEAFLPLFIGALADLDSEAAAEQAKRGDDEDGGVFTAGFDAKVIEIGDLNKTNLKRKMAKAWADDNQAADKHGHRHINVILWDGVSDAVEMAQDMIRLAA